MALSLTHKRAFLKAEDGAVTIPALLWIVFLIFFMFAGIELGVIFIKQTLLTRATEATSRIIRIGNYSSIDEKTLRHEICKQAGFFGSSCMNRVSVEMFQVDKTNWTSSIANHPVRCEDFSDVTKPPPAGTLESAAPDQLILVRVCLREKPMLLEDFIAQAFLEASPVGADGDYALVATTAIVIEPAVASAAGGT
ncbi:TadE/TadG family type IV pilus assembly protein [Thioclava sp. F28-4]|uniref:TadE/TadG family type IV pilus assembly protein n=1 Tax=Thioclava sp. F28-4 TaxID=1915315 RepID=UPI000997ED13|nr:hypothetical protein [Thioclava sp. F28-4]OOY05679.1 hypothetical protein BMI87_06555 [Thioclava sp. F28-4]